MKKFLALVLAACMVLSLVACGSKEEPKQDDQQGGTQDTQEAQFDENGYMKMDESYLSMAAGSAGGGWYVMGAAMNDLFERNMNVHMTLIPGGGSTNPTLVNEGGDVQLGFTYIANATAAVEGKYDYDGAQCENLKALACLNIRQYLGITTTADYTSVEDMVANPKGLKIAVGPRGGGNEIMLNRYLEQLGTSLDELAAQGADVQYISASEGYTAIKDGNVNTCNYQAAIPLSSLVEALASLKMNFISLDQTTAEKVADIYGYSYDYIPAGSYQYQDSDVGTLCDTVILVINSDVDDAVAYNMAKALAENKDALVSAHASFEALDPQVMAQCGIELHPGAQAYYESTGLL